MQGIKEIISKVNLCKLGGSHRLEIGSTFNMVGTIINIRFPLTY